MLTESFGLEAKHGDPDCRSTGFHQKKWENTNVCGRELKIHMRVCVYSCTCAPWEHIYTDFQRGENLPSYKRQMSWHASIARAVPAHFWHWLPCVLVEGNLGCQMPMGAFVWLVCWFWFSSSLDVVAQQFHAHFLPASMATAHCLYLHRGDSMGFRYSPKERALERKLQARVPKKSFCDKKC